MAAAAVAGSAVASTAVAGPVAVPGFGVEEPVAVVLGPGLVASWGLGLALGTADSAMHRPAVREEKGVFAVAEVAAVEAVR